MEIVGAVLRQSGLPRPYAQSRPLDVTQLDLDGPGPSELLIRIEVAGLCHSDLSVVNGSRPRPLPMLLGHEAAGIVEAIGESVDDIALGERVVTVFLPRCERCANCATGGKLPCSVGGESNAAGVLPSGGVRLRGRLPDRPSVAHHLGVSAFASHAVVDRRSVVPIDDDIPPGIAALLGCAVLTGGGAVLNAADLVPGQDVVIVGLGGVGMSALLTARALTHASGGTVVGVDANLDKHAIARSLGADEVHTPEQAIARGVSAPVVIEAAGHPRAFETAVLLTAPGGITVTAGLPAPGAMASIEPLRITAQARTIVGCYLGSAIPARDIPLFAQLWRDGALPLEKLITSTLPLAEINSALDALEEGRALRQMINFS